MGILRRGASRAPLAPLAPLAALFARTLLPGALVALTSLLGACLEGSTTPVLEDEGGPDPPWQAFAIDELRTVRAQQGVDYLQFLAEPAFTMGLLHRPRGVDDNLIAHPNNVVYYVVNGAATLVVDTLEVALAPGTTVFVRSQIEHRIRDIDLDLDMLATFAIGPSQAGDPVARAYTADELVAARDPGENVIDPLVEASTVALGVYMLPREVAGDALVSHPVDEIKIVMRGGSRLDLDSDGVTVASGTIVYIEDGVRHRFRSISDALDILLLWGR